MTTQQFAPPDYRRPAVNPWFIRLPVLFISGSLLLLLVLGVFIGAFQMRYQDKIVPGMWAYNVNLSGMTPEEAEAALASRFTYDDEAVFTFRDGDQFWQTTAGELGVSFDVKGTVEQAYAAGHSGSLIKDLVDQASVWLNGRNLSPIIQYNQNVAVEKLTAIGEEINRAPVDATLKIEGLTVSSTPGQTGRTLDINATLSRLDNVILQLTTGAEIPLVVNETPPLVWDTEAAAAKARAALSGPITLVAESDGGTTLGPWTATPEQIASLLTIEPVYNGDGTQSYAVNVNVQAFSSFLEQLAPGLETAATNARFHFNEDAKELEVFQAGANGRSLNVDETLTRLENAIFSTDVNDRNVPLAFNYTLAKYHENITAAELGITELISQGTTYFTGSTEPRRQNIIAAASRFDGIILAPGEEFSYNDLLGDIGPEAGFVEGLVIVGGRTVKGVGGGVCQVSTTAFQAAFYAGFPILERWPHGYRVGYYERGEGVGMDAAIYQPDEPGGYELDFRFKNDLPHHVLIETSVFPADNSVQFRFYSTSDGRQVVKQGPVVVAEVPAKATLYEENSELLPGQQLQVDWAATGADVTVTRVVLDANGNQIGTDNFFSHYLPWQSIIQVPPGDPRLTQAQTVS
jgi:vancomycin resistance protein YoaR